MIQWVSIEWIFGSIGQDQLGKLRSIIPILEGVFAKSLTRKGVMKEKEHQESRDFDLYCKDRK